MVSKDIDPADSEAVLARIHVLAAANTLRVTRHAEDALFEDGFTLGELQHVASVGVLIENYPVYAKGPCCLLYGDTPVGRPYARSLLDYRTSSRYHHCI